MQSKKSQWHSWQPDNSCVWTRQQVFMVLLLAGFFKPVVKMDADLFVTIACEAILGYQKTNVSGEEAAELFEELKAELDDSSERSFVD